MLGSGDWVMYDAGEHQQGACYTAVYPVCVHADADPPCLVEVALVLVESLVIFPVAVGKGWVAGLVGGALESVPVREPDVVRGAWSARRLRVTCRSSVIRGWP